MMRHAASAARALARCRRAACHARTTAGATHSTATVCLGAHGMARIGDHTRTARRGGSGRTIAAGPAGRTARTGCCPPEARALLPARHTRWPVQPHTQAPLQQASGSWRQCRVVAAVSHARVYAGVTTRADVTLSILLNQHVHWFAYAAILAAPSILRSSRRLDPPPGSVRAPQSPLVPLDCAGTTRYSLVAEAAAVHAVLPRGCAVLRRAGCVARRGGWVASRVAPRVPPAATPGPPTPHARPMIVAQVDARG